jgi:hypothetical protein
MAAGYYGITNQTLTEQWNGTSWSIVTSPNTSTTQNNDLNGGSCTSASFCMAAGYYTYAAPYDQTLIEQFGGAPTLSSLSPMQSCASSPTIVITGSAFTGATEVDFGGVAQTTLTVNSDTQITVSAPSTSYPHTVDVIVTTGNGSSVINQAVDSFQYQMHPPPTGRLHGGKSFSQATPQPLDICYP